MYVLLKHRRMAATRPSIYLSISWLYRSEAHNTKTPIPTDRATEGPTNHASFDLAAESRRIRLHTQKWGTGWRRGGSLNRLDGERKKERRSKNLFFFPVMIIVRRDHRKKEKMQRLDALRPSMDVRWVCGCCCVPGSNTHIMIIITVMMMITRRNEKMSKMIFICYFCPIHPSTFWPFFRAALKEARFYFHVVSICYAFYELHKGRFTHDFPPCYFSYKKR